MTKETKIIGVTTMIGAASMILCFITCNPIFFAVGCGCGCFAGSVILATDK